MGGRSISSVPAGALAVILAAYGTIAPAQEMPERIEGRPNLNGVWQAIGTAHWNIEGHSAEALPEFWQLGAIGAIPAGQSVVEGGNIPYLPAALAVREENRAGWPGNDPEAKCYQPGIPRAIYLPYPFRIVQGVGDILFAYEFASANRVVHMDEVVPSPIESYMGWSNGRWEGDTLVIEVTDFNGLTWFDRAGNHHSNALRVIERYTLAGPNHIDYEATIEDPNTFSRPWTVSMPLYRRVENNAQLLEYKCVEFAEELLYGHLKKVEE
ncbi:MAG TPA: hypothetical protein VMR74_13320 [Gammaproteobacteria bacterium]|nr:hypothetical protein [Gammaproteobacteria bacterium]